MSDTPTLARMKRTRERLIEVLRMITKQEDDLRVSLQEISASIEDEEMKV